MMALSLDSANQLNLERKGGKKIKTKNIPGLTERVILSVFSSSYSRSLRGSCSSANQSNGGISFDSARAKYRWLQKGKPSDGKQCQFSTFLCCCLQIRSVNTVRLSRDVSISESCFI